jgi:hypothetical protein
MPPSRNEVKYNGKCSLHPLSPYVVRKEIMNFDIIYYSGDSQPQSRKPNFGPGNFPTGRRLRKIIGLNYSSFDSLCSEKCKTGRN